MEIVVTLLSIALYVNGCIIMSTHNDHSNNNGKIRLHHIKTGTICGDLHFVLSSRMVKIGSKKEERERGQNCERNRHTSFTAWRQVLKNTSDKLCNNDILILLKERWCLQAKRRQQRAGVCIDVCNGNTNGTICW